MKKRLALAAALALLLSFGGAWLAGLVPGPTAPPSAQPPRKGPAPTGFVDLPTELAVLGPRISIQGWAQARDGIRAVEVRWPGGRREASTGIARSDISGARPELTGKPAVGWAFTHDFGAEPLPPGWERRRLAIIAIGTDGQETRLASRDVIEPSAFTRWASYVPKPAAPSPPERAFYLLPATSGVGAGGAAELDTDYRAFLSDTMRVGVRVPILYMRTTFGRARDYAFDPDFDLARKCAGGRRMAEDTLAATFAHAKAKRLPVLVTLNGGIWADSGCDAPEWDLNDHLESDPANCQWNEKNEVMADDALKHLPGSHASPELGRSLTYNVYATEVRRLKKRNLQQAARFVAQFHQRDPGLLVGVNLDPDVYINPFYAQRQWYDFNPGTLRQFRHWLAATGPYAGATEPGIPDLRRFRRAKPLTLAQVNALAGREYRSWDEVDAPRHFPRDGPRPYWKDPWVEQWEHFRRHLVQLHYDELAEWLAEAGVASSRIWSGQGFTPSYDDAMPIATRVTSSARNYDTAGVSVEGSKPARGHIGAIVYGDAAANDMVLEEDRSLFDWIRFFDRDWSVIEFNTTNLRTPHERPPADRAHRALRELWNYGARFVSPMAWNGSHGHYTDHPEYVPFTSWRGTAAEEVAKDFMLARANLPRGAMLWTFGSPGIPDTDKWVATTGAIASLGSALTLTPAAGRLVMESPKELSLVAPRSRVVVLDTGTAPIVVEVSGRAARDPPGQWKPLGRGDARKGVQIGGLTGGIDQVRLALAMGAQPATLTRVAILPAR